MPAAWSLHSMHEPNSPGSCTGLGMDLTTMGVEVRLRDPEEDPLPPAPLLVVATSDGTLRLFSFSHASRPTQGIVKQPLPLQAVQPVLASEQVAQVRAVALPQPWLLHSPHWLVASTHARNPHKDLRHCHSKAPVLCGVMCLQEGKREPAMSVPKAEERAAAAPLPDSDSEEDTEDQSASERQQKDAAQGRAEGKQPATASAGGAGGLTEDRAPAESGGESPSRADVSGPVVAKAAATRLPDDSSSDEAESPKGASAESSLVQGHSDAHSEAAQGRGGALGGRRLDFSFAGDDASSDNSSSRTEATSAPRPKATAPPMVDTPSLPIAFPDAVRPAKCIHAALYAAQVMVQRSRQHRCSGDWGCDSGRPGRKPARERSCTVLHNPTEQRGGPGHTLCDAGQRRRSPVPKTPDDLCSASQCILKRGYAQWRRGMHVASLVTCPLHVWPFTRL